jgi:hypothetical protein
LVKELIVIRDGSELSLKASFVFQLIKIRSDMRFLFVFRSEKDKFREKWNYNCVELATSVSGIFLYYFLTILNPKDIRDAIIRRFHRTKTHILLQEGSFSQLTHALYQYFGKSARTDRLMVYLEKQNLPKIFLVDEFLSLNSASLKMIKHFGPVVYISQDLAYNHFSFSGNYVAKRLVYKLERDAVTSADLVIACSETERLKYIEMGAAKAVFYPNIYSIPEFDPCEKEPEPSIVIALPKYWGPRAEKSLKEIFNALSHVNKRIKVYMIGMKPGQIPKNIELKYLEHIPDKLEYLRTLSRSWAGINVGMHLGGTNERKYDYAMAATVVFSDVLGARGDLLPNECTYVDGHDLAAKLEQFFVLEKKQIAIMGIQNRKQALSLACRQQESLLEAVNDIIKT